MSFSYKRKILFLGTKKACSHLGTDFFFLSMLLKRKNRLMY
ncbi:hypothetical protein BSSX_2483 [Bacillus subtilis]|nr:hypothetical protein BSSX_2483 [Bacillus subtilis]